MRAARKGRAHSRARRLQGRAKTHGSCGFARRKARPQKSIY